MGVVHLHGRGGEGLRPGPPRPGVVGGRPQLGEDPDLGPQPRRHVRAGPDGLRGSRGGQVHLGLRVPLVRGRALRSLARALRGLVRRPPGQLAAAAGGEGPPRPGEPAARGGAAAREAHPVQRGLPGAVGHATANDPERVEVRRALRHEHHRRHEQRLRGLDRLEPLPERGGRPQPRRQQLPRPGDLRHTEEGGDVHAALLPLGPLLALHTSGGKARPLQHKPRRARGDQLHQPRREHCCGRAEPEQPRS
mmetsp:Transcript_5740/g.15899  ORF Transcript_5740/g.15899 Transcript_5740/m.15899 type:complete len:250 (+) Transcript_5740:1051-1800(+)